MRSLARTSLGLLSLALIAPGTVKAQDAPPSYVSSGYQAVAPVGLDGKPVDVSAPAPAPAMAAPVVEAPHKHRGRTLCAKCAAKLKASNGEMPPGTIVGCAHSKNGVCTACAAALKLPGTFVSANSQPPIMSAGSPVEAPGRAVASSGAMPNSSMARMGRPGTPMSTDEPMAEPAPVGVVQANFSQGGPMMMPGAPAGYAPQTMPPGRAMAESTPGRDPYQAKSGMFPHPHIIGHLLGWTGIGSERAEEKARRKAEAHAMMSYEKDAAGPVEELPASMVFGKKR